jgi:hypothetical protein
MPGKSLIVASPRRTGRPSSYTHAIGQEICLRLAEGEGLQHICDSRDDMPSIGTALRWYFNDEGPGFREMYTRARQIQVELFADQAIAIADTPQLGVVIKTTEKGTEVREGDMIEHRQLRIETRKWFLARLLPKKYGIQVETGQIAAEGDKAITIVGGLPD